MISEESRADGPWRCSASLRIAVLASVGDLGAAAAAARLSAAFAAAGVPLAEARAVPPGALRAFLQKSAGADGDVLVVEPETSVSPGAVMELRRVADGDPMIVAALPRFSAAPGPGHPPGASPEVDYALPPDRRCAYLKGSALLALGPGVFADGEDAFAAPLFALGRAGFRVVVAGRAEAFHPLGAASVVPVPVDWRPALERRAGSAPARADALLDALRPGPDGRRSLAFDLGHAGPRHSGTTLLARALVGRAAARWSGFDLRVIATPEAFVVHFAGIPGLTRVDPADPCSCAALVRFGQPFLWGEVEAAVRRAPVLVLFMLDTIGLDCQRDAPPELDALWRFCIANSDGLLFNSAFTARQFRRRFGPPPCPALPSLHSLDLADYRLGPAADAPVGGTVLLIGNAMPHKRLRETAALLAGASLGRPIAALGLASGAVEGVEGAGTGDASAEDVAGRYASARIVVYPSVYEGFGFPILDALAHRRPILVRDLPPYAEICAGLPERANVHRFRDDADLVRLLREPPPWTDERAGGKARSWDDALDDLGTVLDAALRGADRGRIVRRIDALRGRMAYMRARAYGETDATDELDRLAGLAGRVVHGAILWVGRHVPGTRLGLAGLHRLFGRLRRGAAP